VELFMLKASWTGGNNLLGQAATFLLSLGSTVEEDNSSRAQEAVKEEDEQESSSAVCQVHT
jgi:hypothetical protein